MANQKKIEQVKELTQKIKNSDSIVFVDYKGISVNQDTEIRKEMRENGIEYIVAKNKLFKIALKNAEINENFDDVLKGSTSFAFGTNDTVSHAKIAYDFGADRDFYEIKAGYLNGKRIEKDEVIKIAKLPSREVLLQQLLFLNLSPIMNFTYALLDLKRKKEEQSEISEPKKEEEAKAPEVKVELKKEEEAKAPEVKVKVELETKKTEN